MLLSQALQGNSRTAVVATQGSECAFGDDFVDSAVERSGYCLPPVLLIELLASESVLLLRLSPCQSAFEDSMHLWRA